MKRGEAASTSKSILGKKRVLKNGKLDSPGPLAQSPKCPECGSLKNWKDGVRLTKNGEVQRWLCRDCGYRFSQPNIKINVTAQMSKMLHPGANLAKQMICRRKRPFKKSLDRSFLLRSENIRSHGSKPQGITTVGKDLNAFPHYNSDCQVCVSEREAKNLSQQNTRQKQAAGATKPDKATIKGKIVEFAWYLKKQGYSSETIKTYTSNLKRLHKYGADLLNGESVKETIAQQENWNTSTKHTAVTSYMAFTRSHGLNWDPPSYKPQTKLPFIPLESEIDALIASTGKKTSTILQLLKETAMRIGEACRLKWIDLDLEHNTITVNDPEKHGKPRMFKISSKLAAMLNALPRVNNNLLGKTKACDASKTLIIQRKRTASKLQNPRINYIHFHTLRHWKATMEYHKTKDILHVKEMLGHRCIDNTLIYTQLISFENYDFHVKVAKTLKEDKELIEAGFEYVTERDDLKIYRKRK